MTHKEYQTVNDTAEWNHRKCQIKADEQVAVSWIKSIYEQQTPTNQTVELGVGCDKIRDVLL